MLKVSTRTVCLYAGSVCGDRWRPTSADLCDKHCDRREDAYYTARVGHEGDPEAVTRRCVGQSQNRHLSIGLAFEVHKINHVARTYIKARSIRVGACVRTGDAGLSRISPWTFRPTVKWPQLLKATSKECKVCCYRLPHLWFSPEQSRRIPPPREFRASVR